MSYKQRIYLTQVNRVAILALSLIGQLMDGAQLSDLVFSTTLVLWLWLPHCTRIEARLLEKLDRDSRHLMLSGNRR